MIGLLPLMLLQTKVGSSQSTLQQSPEGMCSLRPLVSSAETNQSFLNPNHSSNTSVQLQNQRERSGRINCRALCDVTVKEPKVRSAALMADVMTRDDT